MKGSLYQRGDSRKWYLRYDVTPEPGKARKQKNVCIGKMSKAEAEVRKREILHYLDKGVSDGGSSSRLVEQFLNSWLETRRRNLAATTFARYKHMVERDINPVVGNVRLSKVQPEHIERVYEIARKRGLSERSCLHIHRMLHKAFKDAVRKKWLAENVVKLVEAPRPAERELAPISHNLVRSIIEGARGSRLEVPVGVAAVTGLRRGEILALRWRNVDLKNDALHVTESLEQTRQYGVRFKCPKSKSSKRSLPLSPECVALLCAHKGAQDAAKGDAGLYYDDQDLVFPNPDGTPWPPDTFSAQFGKLAARLKLKGFRFHDLRHAFASLTLADGASVKQVQSLMGHSNASTTLSVYARPFDGLGRKAVNDLSQSLLA